METLIDFVRIGVAKVTVTKMSQNKHLGQAIVAAGDGDRSLFFPEIDPVGDSTVLWPDFRTLGSVSMLPSNSDLGRFGASNFGRKNEYISYFDSVLL